MSPGTYKGGEAAGRAANGKGKGQNEAGEPQEHEEREACMNGDAFRQIIALLQRGSGIEKDRDGKRE